mgnify:CR=1 FL=1
MGYYFRMEDILNLQLKSQEQIERWKEELQEVGKTLEVLGDTNELQGEAGTKLKNNIKKTKIPLFIFVNMGYHILQSAKYSGET